MHVEDEAPDGRSRQPAIIHEFAPVRVSRFQHVLTESVEQVEGVSRVQPFEAQLNAQGLGLRVGRPASAERVVETIEQRELLVGRQIGMVGDVVGRSRETIVGEDRRAPLLAQEPGGDGKILVAAGLAGKSLCRRRHDRPPSLAGAWKRPFQ